MASTRNVAGSDSTYSDRAAWGESGFWPFSITALVILLAFVCPGGSRGPSAQALKAEAELRQKEWSEQWQRNYLKRVAEAEAAERTVPAAPGRRRP